MIHTVIAGLMMFNTNRCLIFKKGGWDYAAYFKLISCNFLLGFLAVLDSHCGLIEVSLTRFTTAVLNVLFNTAADWIQLQRITISPHVTSWLYILHNLCNNFSYLPSSRHAQPPEDYVSDLTGSFKTSQWPRWNKFLLISEKRPVSLHKFCCEMPDIMLT